MSLGAFLSGFGGGYRANARAAGLKPREVRVAPYQRRGGDLPESGSVVRTRNREGTEALTDRLREQGTPYEVVRDGRVAESYLGGEATESQDGIMRPRRSPVPGGGDVMASASRPDFETSTLPAPGEGATQARPLPRPDAAAGPIDVPEDGGTGGDVTASSRDRKRPPERREKSQPQGVGFGWGAGSMGGTGYDPNGWQPRRPIEAIAPEPRQVRTREVVDLSGLNNPDMGMIEPGHDSALLALGAPSQPAPTPRAINPDPQMSARTAPVESVSPPTAESAAPPAIESAPIPNSPDDPQPADVPRADTAGIANATRDGGAPTAGMPFMLPSENPDRGDPRRGRFQTEAPRVDDPNVYTTEIVGNTEGVNPELLSVLGNSAEQAIGPGGTVRVSSGYRPHSAGSQHSVGEAADIGVDTRDGRTLTADDPETYDVARVATGSGEISGVGIGPDYMGGQYFHFDTGRGGVAPSGARAPDFGNRVRTWSDWNTGENLRRHGRGASDPGGAGDPDWNFRAELQGIRDGQPVLSERNAPSRVASAPSRSIRPPGRPRTRTVTSEGREVTASTRTPAAGSDLVQPPEQFRDMAHAAATQYGLDPGLFNAVVFRESTWRPEAQSPQGAFGLTQAMPATAERPGYNVSPMRDRGDPEEQLRFGAEYLSAMIDHYDGDVRRALVAYNWGPGNANSWDGRMSSLPRETREYVQFIEANMGGERAYNRNGRQAKRAPYWVRKFMEGKAA